MTHERIYIILGFLSMLSIYGGLLWLCAWAGRQPWARREDDVGAQWFEDETPADEMVRFPVRLPSGRISEDRDVRYTQNGLIRRREDER